MDECTVQNTNAIIPLDILREQLKIHKYCTLQWSCYSEHNKSAAFSCPIRSLHLFCPICLVTDCSGNRHAGVKYQTCTCTVLVVLYSTIRFKLLYTARAMRRRSENLDLLELLLSKSSFSTIEDSLLHAVSVEKTHLVKYVPLSPSRTWFSFVRSFGPDACFVTRASDLRRGNLSIGVKRNAAESENLTLRITCRKSLESSWSRDLSWLIVMNIQHVFASTYFTVNLYRVQYVHYRTVLNIV